MKFLWNGGWRGLEGVKGQHNCFSRGCCPDALNAMSAGNALRPLATLPVTNLCKCRQTETKLSRASSCSPLFPSLWRVPGNCNLISQMLHVSFGATFVRANITRLSLLGRKQARWESLLFSRPSLWHWDEIVITAARAIRICYCPWYWRVS
jgi:hypothetical protein